MKQSHSAPQLIYILSKQKRIQYCRR